jgi:hypothetical protein
LELQNQYAEFFAAPGAGDYCIGAFWFERSHLADARVCVFYSEISAAIFAFTPSAR